MQVEDAGSVIRTARSVGGGADSFSTFAVQGPSHMVASDGEGAVRAMPTHRAFGCIA